MTTYRVTLAPSGGASKVLTIAQPSLRVTISKGGGAALPTEKTFGDAKVYGSLVKGYAANGLPNADTQAAIDYALAQGYPAWSIIWMYQGEAVAGSVSSTATVPAFSAWSTFTPPSVTATAVSEAVSASATIPALTALASFTAPTVTGQSGVTATASVPLFSAVSTFAAPTVYATRNASATVPQFAASATFAAPSVTVTPAGATAASVTVPSFGAVATLTAPSVAAQGAATASVPSFSALASLSAASVTGQRLATATMPQFSAISSLSAPSVTGVVQTLATVAVPQFAAVSTLTAPTVAATRVATASVPSFGATAAFTSPTAAGVQQAAAVSATAAVPSFTARATLTAPSAAGVQMSAAPTQPVISATGGDTTVTIAKTSGGTGATSYDLKWGTAAGSRPNTISGVTLPYTHTGRTNGTTYYYSLVATNAQGSTESAEVNATPAAIVLTVDSFETGWDGWTVSMETVTPVAEEWQTIITTDGSAVRFAPGLNGTSYCVRMKSGKKEVDDYGEIVETYPVHMYLEKTVVASGSSISIWISGASAANDKPRVYIDGVEKSFSLTNGVPANISFSVTPGTHTVRISSANNVGTLSDIDQISY